MISQSVSKQFNQLECLPKVVHTTNLDSKSEANMLRPVHIKSTLAPAITDYPVIIIVYIFLSDGDISKNIIIHL